MLAFPVAVQSNLLFCRLNKMGISAIVMSPPCQPFTRQGLQKDIGDARTEPLLNVIKMIPDLERLDYVLVENVKGKPCMGKLSLYYMRYLHTTEVIPVSSVSFHENHSMKMSHPTQLGFEISEARNRLVSTLSSSGFVCREFLLTPTQIGIPNSRLRYYLIAKKSDIATSDGLLESLPEDKIIEEFPGVQRIECETLGKYLETGNHLDDYLVGSEVFKKHAEVADIVNAEGLKSCCFTKSYGRYVEGTGKIDFIPEIFSIM